MFVVQSLEEHVEKRRLQLEQLEKWWSVGEEEKQRDSDVNLLFTTLQLQPHEMYVPTTRRLIAMMVEAITCDVLLQRSDEEDKSSNWSDS